MTLRIKASMILGILISVSLGVSAYYSLNYFEDSLRASILGGLDGVSKTISNEISRFLTDSLKEAEAVAQAIPKSAIERKDAQRTDQILKTYSGIFSKFENGMFILDERGSLWADYPKTPKVRGRSFAFRQYFQETMRNQKGVVGVPYRSARTGAPVVTFTAPLRDSNDRIVGMLGCSVRLTSPEALEGIRLTKIGQSGYIYVYNKNRLVILHPKENRILKRDMPVGANKLFDAAIEGFEGTGETVNSYGIPMLISMRHVPHSDWIIGAQQSKSEAFASIRPATVRIVWGIVLMAMISVMIGLLLMNNITKPLSKLQDAIRSFSNAGGKEMGYLLTKHFLKDLEAIKARGEIGNLKAAFVSMSEKLVRTINSQHDLARDWENTFDSVLDAIILLDEHHTITRLNKSASALFNRAYQELIGRPIFDFLNIATDDLLSVSETNKQKDKTFNISVNGNRVYEIFLNSLLDDEKNVVGKVLVGRDVTYRLEASKEKLRLEEKLQNARKMEAIGTLAGGVAHDLNNILSGIVSYPELILLQLPKDSPLIKPIKTILQSGEKAAAIVQDLLTLARRGTEIFEVVDLNTIVNEYLQSPEYSRIRAQHPMVIDCVNLADDLFNIEGSSVHLSKTIMNLVLNAAEAMPNGGKIHISTENRYIDTEFQGHEDIAEGDYVVLTIADEGSGIASDDMNRIFEPFYTKKELGHSGTGLGMSVVWGTIKDHKGYIDLKSTIGEGTTFDIFFPATRKERQDANDSIDIELLYGNNETILVIDDVETQRVIATSILTQLGYSVNHVSSGEEALRYLKATPADLLVLDMIMPNGLNGLETYKRVLEFNPKQKAIITSGFSETDLVVQTQAMGAGVYVKKPYTIEKIGAAVKKNS